MNLRKTLLFLASLLAGSILLNTSILAGSPGKPKQPGGATPLYCIESTEELERQVAQKGLKFLFSGITRNGIPLWFYSNNTSFTVFYRTPDRDYCTTPNYYGDIIDLYSGPEPEGNDT